MCVAASIVEAGPGKMLVVIKIMITENVDGGNVDGLATGDFRSEWAFVEVGIDRKPPTRRDKYQFEVLKERGCVALMTALYEVLVRNYNFNVLLVGKSGTYEW